MADAQAHGSEQQANIVYESLHYLGVRPFILEFLEIPRYVTSQVLCLLAHSLWCRQLRVVDGCLVEILRYAAMSGTARATTPRASLCTEAKAAGNGWMDLDYPLGQAEVDR